MLDKLWSSTDPWDATADTLLSWKTIVNELSNLKRTLPPNLWQLCFHLYEYPMLHLSPTET